MAGATELLAALKPETTLGPDHHRFRLKGVAVAHPLGTLWPAEDISTPRPTPVSLLFIAPGLLDQRGFVEQLRNRLNRLRNLRDPYVASCFGYFTWRGLFFISWDLAEGQTLQQLFDARKAYRFTARQKQGLVTQVARALNAGLAETRAPHALLAPELIHLLPGKGIRLTGFGWRELLQPLASQLQPPLSYLAWQAPEAFHPNPLDASADVYALAALIYQLYAGKPAFSELDGEASRQRELKAPGGLSKAQWRTLQSALALAPEQRPASPLELVRLLYQDVAAPPAETEPAPVDAELTPAPAADLTAVDGASVSPSPPPVASTPDLTKPAPAGRRLRLGWLPRVPPRLKAAGLFAAGLGLGFWLGWQLSPAPTAPAIATNNVQANTQTARNATPEADATAPGPASPATLAETAAVGDELVPGPDQPAALGTPLDPVTSSTAAAAYEMDGFDAVHNGQAVRDDTLAADNLTRFQDSLANGGYGPEMVLIPRGRFRMGDLHGQGDDNETPVHEVVISRRYALSRYEVSFEEYDRFADATGRPRPDDNGWGRGRQPVVNVSWHDARAYVRWLADQSGQPYRLPSEAEWEYAARAGTETLYWWGDELTPGRAVCDECGSDWDGRQPAPVGSFAANPWGLHDLNGNVDEWVQDCYHDSYDGAPGDGSAWSGSSCEHRVMRGGSWFDIGRLVRSASRYRHPADATRNSWGFRVALDLPPDS